MLGGFSAQQYKLDGLSKRVIIISEVLRMSKVKKKQKSNSKTVVLLILGLVIVPVIIVLAVLFNSKSNQEEYPCGTLGEVTDKNNDDDPIYETEATIQNNSYDQFLREKSDDIVLGFSDAKSEVIKEGDELIIQSPISIVRRFQEKVPGTWISINTSFQCDSSFNTQDSDVFDSQVLTYYECSDSEEYSVPYGSSCIVSYDEEYQFVKSLSIELYSESWEESADVLNDVFYYATNNEIVSEWVSKGYVTPMNVLQQSLNETVEVEGGQWQITVSKENDSANYSHVRFSMVYYPLSDSLKLSKSFVSYNGLNTENHEGYTRISSAIFENALRRVASDEEVETDNSVIEESRPQQNLVLMSDSEVEPIISQITENFNELVETLRDGGYSFIDSASDSYTVNNFSSVITDSEEAPSMTADFILPIQASSDSSESYFLEIQYYYDKSAEIGFNLEGSPELKDSLEQWFQTLGDYDCQELDSELYVDGQI